MSRYSASPSTTSSSAVERLVARWGTRATVYLIPPYKTNQRIRLLNLCGSPAVRSGCALVHEPYAATTPNNGIALMGLAGSGAVARVCTGTQAMRRSKQTIDEPPCGSYCASSALHLHAAGTYELRAARGVLR